MWHNDLTNIHHKMVATINLVNIHHPMCIQSKRRRKKIFVLVLRTLGEIPQFFVSVSNLGSFFSSALPDPLPGSQAKWKKIILKTHFPHFLVHIHWIFTEHLLYQINLLTQLLTRQNFWQNSTKVAFDSYFSSVSMTFLYFCLLLKPIIFFLR